VSSLDKNPGSAVWLGSDKLLFSANLHDDSDFEPNNSEIHVLDINSGEVKQLTTRFGPDSSPVVSPDKSKIAFLGYDDKYLGYQQNSLYVMDTDGSNVRLISEGFDRNIGNRCINCHRGTEVNAINWMRDGKGLYFQYDTEGMTKISSISLSGKVKDIVDEVGGLSLGRSYSGGSYTISPSGRYAFTYGNVYNPADLAVGFNGSKERLTHLNKDLFDYKELGKVEEVWYESSYDGKKIHGWLVYPPNFDPAINYPLILEIHGGPFLNYGFRFSAEVQLFASEGYFVLYTNPRGSTSYGKDFANLIHHNYPSQDYDDLMSGVDHVIKRDYIDGDNLFVTGGSGGGVLTSWIVGKTDRFRAAVVEKPVINWYSFVLYADRISFFYKYWFPGMPWDNLEEYMKRSPISYVGNVTTPTMLLTGEDDYRTPIAESEQFYAGLKLNKVESMLVRIPGASHGIAARPSNLIAKVNAITAWFDKYKK
jgi:acylaminoacyl-peptidase